MSSIEDHKDTTTPKRGEPLTVKNRTGEDEAVFVREMPMKEYPDYVRVVDDEERAVEFLCDKPPGWADTLPPDSVGEIVEVGERLNQAVFPWLARRMRRINWCGRDGKIA